MWIRITHLRNTKKHQDNQDDGSEKFAGSLASADRSTDVTTQHRADQTDGGRDHQPKRRDLVTVGLKNAFDAQPEVNENDNGKGRAGPFAFANGNANQAA